MKGTPIPAASELEALRAEVESLRAIASERDSQIMSLTSERDVAREDAARYRWLREQHWSHKTLTVVHPDSVGLSRMTYGRERLDAAIDAAMNPSTQEPTNDR